MINNSIKILKNVKYFLKYFIVTSELLNCQLKINKLPA